MREGRGAGAAAASGPGAASRNKGRPGPGTERARSPGGSAGPRGPARPRGGSGAPAVCARSPRPALYRVRHTAAAWGGAAGTGNLSVSPSWGGDTAPALLPKGRFIITGCLNLAGGTTSRVPSEGLLPAEGFGGSPFCGFFSPLNSFGLIFFK